MVLFSHTKVSAQKSAVWEPVTKDNQNKSIKLSNKESFLSDYKLFRLNSDLLQSKLDTNGLGSNQEYVLIQLPDLSGQLISFKVAESCNHAPGFAKPVLLNSHIQGSWNRRPYSYFAI